MGCETREREERGEVGEGCEGVRWKEERAEGKKLQKLGIVGEEEVWSGRKGESEKRN